MYVVATPRREQKAGTSPKPNLVTEMKKSLLRFSSVLGAVPISKCKQISMISSLNCQKGKHELKISQMGYELMRTP